MRRLTEALAILLTVVQIPALAADPIRIDLDRAVDLALEHNVSMKNAAEERTKAEAQRKEAFSAALPVVSSFAQLSHSFSIAGQPVSFPVPFGVIDGSGNPVPLTIDGSPIPNTDEFGNIVPGEFLQATGIQLVPFEFAFGNDNTAIYGLNVTQPIFEGRVIAAIRGANVYGDLAASAYDVTRLQVEEQASIAFYSALMADKMLEVMQNSLTVAQRNLSDARALYQQGKAAEFDVIRAEVAVANGETNLSNARKMQEIATAGLKRACGLSLDAEINIEGDLVQEPDALPTLEELEARLLARQPLLDQLSASTRLNKENILMAQAEYMPQVALTGSYQQMNPFNDGEYDGENFRESSSLAVGVNIPIFKGFGSKARVQKAKADHRKSQYTEVDMRENLLLELSNLHMSLQEAVERIEAGEKGVEMARKGVEMAERLYTEGMSSQVQVLDAQNARDQAELGLFQAYYEYYSAKASLVRALGGEI